LTRRAGAAATAGLAGADAPDRAGTGRDAGAPDAVTFDGRLVYLDGAPAVGVLLHLAVGRPIEARVFRNGEHTKKTIHLVTAHEVTSTGEGGSFLFPPVRRPARSRAFVYTVRDPQAFAVEELFCDGQTVRARRRVTVSGRLVDRDGKPLDDFWFEGRLGKPEDWHTRVLYEEDTFAGAAGDLGVDTLATDDTRTRGDGSFALGLAQGRNTLVFGETKETSMGIDVMPLATELGELRVPGPELLPDAHSLSGQVLTLGGAPHAGCDVMAWDGSVGIHTHMETTDERGMFTIEGLKSPNVILWAVPTERRHIDLPVQTTATIRMPCAAPIVLRAPAEEEYAWARIRIPGFYLFARTDVFATGEALDATDAVGVPPGPLHIHLVTDRILEASLDIREPGDLVLDPSRFRDTTWE
jgi:hypothetical protein